MSDNPAAKEAFISHASDNAALAQGLVQQLEQAGVRCWIAPRDIRQGEVYADEIMRGIRACPVFVLLHSEAADQSPFVLREVNEAVTLNKKVLPVRVGAFTASDRMRFLLAAIQWESAEVRDGQLAHQGLLSRIQTLLQGSTAAPDQRRTVPPPQAIPRRLWLWAVGLLVVLALGGGYWLSRQGDPPLVLRGEVDVRVLSDNSVRNEHMLGEYGMAPVQHGERVRIEAKLNQPAYVYLVWLSNEGVAPAYPWAPNDWSRRAESESPRERIALPERADRAYPMKCGDGMEAVLLLARSTPLPATIDLKAILGGFPHERDAGNLCYRLAGEEIEVVLPPPPQSAERPADFNTPTAELDRPEETRGSLRSWWVGASERLTPHFDHVSGIVFATSQGAP